MRALLLLAALSAQLGAWQSARVTQAANGSLSYSSDAEGNRIPDWGWVGYQEGCQAIPDVPVKMTLGPVAGDNTTSINNALAAMAALPLQADGTRGALLLLPGTYNVSGIIRVDASGVVLRGSGNGTDPAVDSIIVGTNTAFDATTDRGEYAVLRVGKSGLSGAGFVGLSGTQVNVTDAFLPPGSDTLTVSDVSPFKVGDWAVVSHPLSAAWLAAVNYGDTATAPPWSTSDGPIVQSRRIRAIDVANKRLTLAGGLFHPLRLSLSQSTVAKADLTRFITQAGVEDLRVDIVHASLTDEHHARSAVELSRLINGWARRVKARYYWHGAVVVSNAAQVTVRDCEGSDMAGIITGERGYTFSAESHSNNILFTKDIARDGRHNYISSAGFSSNGIVFHDCESWHAQGSAYMEGHMHWSVGLLYDNVRHLSAQTGQALGLYNRGDFGTNHGWAAAHSVAWNVNVGTADIIIQKPPTAQNYAIGCFADQITGAKPPAPFSQPTGYIEGSGQAGLVPASLYLAQLAAKSCPAPAQSPTPSPSATRTRSATPTGTRTPSTTATRSATPSPSQSASPTRSASASPTPSATRTPTATGTGSVTESPARTLTASATLSPTLSETPSPSQSASPTRSATPSPTPSASLSLTLTQLPSASATPTPSASPSASPSPSPTLSASGTLTAAMTPSLTATPSSSATATASPSARVSATPSITASLTRTLSGTPSLSPQPSPSSSATATRTPTASPSHTGSRTATMSPSSPSPSPTASPPLSTTVTPTRSRTMSPLSPTLSETPSPVAKQGALNLRLAMAFPNPIQGRLLRLRYFSDGPAASLQVQVYSVSSACVHSQVVPGPARAGWDQAELQLPALAPGFYSARVRLIDGVRSSEARLIKLWLLP